MADSDGTVQSTGGSQADAASSATSQTDQGSTTEDIFDKDRAMATINKLREQLKELGKAPKELAAAQARLKEIEDANKTEAEKRDEKLREYESKEQQRLRENAALLVRVAVTEFTADTDCLDKAWLKEKLQASASLELDDDGIPTTESLEKALKGIRKSYPALFKPEGPQAPQVSTGGTVNADRTQQQSLNPNAVYNLSDPALWNGSQVAGGKK